ncbi:MAG TPA: DUF742 domain-containing protein [Acidimicrobiales bacterium]|jgi:hypothetical protein
MMWERGTPKERELRLVRPYALTGGRTRAKVGDLPIEALIMAAVAPRDRGALRHEARRIVDLCDSPISVAEVSARIHVPLGAARVLVGDLVADGLVEVHRMENGNGRPDVRLLERVLDGLQAL